MATVITDNGDGGATISDDGSSSGGISTGADPVAHAWVDGAGGFPDASDPTAFFTEMNRLSVAIAAVNPSFVPQTWAPPTAGTPVSAQWLNELESRISSIKPSPTTSGQADTATPEMFKASATLDTNGAVADWAPAINAAFAAGYTDIQLGPTYYTIRTPIRVPSNKGARIRGHSALKATVLNVFLPQGSDTAAAIDVLGMSNGTGYNYGGFNLEHVWIRGNNSVSHGVRMQDLSYPWVENVVIEGFRGAGLYLDVVMDGYFNVTIQDCGRTSGDYTSLADRSNNAKTLYSPLFITSYRPGEDACNMIRITGDIEQNKVSPYVRVDGGIGIQFTDIHAEVRTSSDWNSFDFLSCGGGDLEFVGMNMDKFRDGFLLNPYGVYRFNGGRSIPSIKNTSSGNGQLIVSNVNGGAVQLNSWAGDHSISNSKLGDVTFSYPGGGVAMVKGSKVGNVLISNNGAPQGAVILSDTYMTTFTADAGSSNWYLRDSDIAGTVAAAGRGSVENCGFGGISVGPNVSFAPRHKRGAGAAPPTSGSWSVGDVYENSTPSPGGYLGWVCTSAGTPGTWKGFGLIQS